MVVGKDKTAFYTSHHVTAITFLLIGIIITTSISFVFPLVLSLKYNSNTGITISLRRTRHVLKWMEQKARANQDRIWIPSHHY